MQVLAWLLIPLLATALGIAWVMWRGREPKPVDAEQGMEEMARFRQAMERPLPALRREPVDPGDAAADDPR